MLFSGTLDVAVNGSFFLVDSFSFLTCEFNLLLKLHGDNYFFT